jgi:hypothetical protein
MLNKKIDYSLKDIPVCKGRNRKFKKSKSLYKGLFILFGIFVCDKEFNLKNKIKVIKQIFNNFYKNPFLFKMKIFLKDKNLYLLNEGDMIHLNVPLNLSALKKFFQNLGFKIIDYKKLKKKKYSMNFLFYLNNNINEHRSDILLDLNVSQFGIINVFININIFLYYKDLMQLIFYYNLNKNFKFSII